MTRQAWPAEGPNAVILLKAANCTSASDDPFETMALFYVGARFSVFCLGSDAFLALARGTGLSEQHC